MASRRGKDIADVLEGICTDICDACKAACAGDSEVIPRCASHICEVHIPFLGPANLAPRVLLEQLRALFAALIGAEDYALESACRAAGAEGPAMQETIFYVFNELCYQMLLRHQRYERRHFLRAAYAFLKKLTPMLQPEQRALFVPFLGPPSHIWKAAGAGPEKDGNEDDDHAYEQEWAQQLQRLAKAWESGHQAPAMSDGLALGRAWDAQSADLDTLPSKVARKVLNHNQDGILIRRKGGEDDARGAILVKSAKRAADDLGDDMSNHTKVMRLGPQDENMDANFRPQNDVDMDLDFIAKSLLMSEDNIRVGIRHLLRHASRIPEILHKRPDLPARLCRALEKHSGHDIFRARDLFLPYLSESSAEKLVRATRKSYTGCITRGTGGGITLRIIDSRSELAALPEDIWRFR